MRLREQKFERLAPNAPWPPGLREALREATKHQWLLQRCGTESTCLVFPADLDNDGEPEELVASEVKHSRMLLAFGHEKGGDWKVLGMLWPTPGGAEPQGGQSFDKAIRAGDYRTTEPHYRDVEIGVQKFRLGAP